MQDYIKIHEHYINKELHNFFCEKLSNEKVTFDDKFWIELSKILSVLENTRKKLITKREKLQNQINYWHLENRSKFFDKEAYKKFLYQIGYLIPEGIDFKIHTKDIDEEIALIAGPQLVVPLMNARYAINAANARWGSLFDALYGTNVIPNEWDLKTGESYNEKRGLEVINFANKHLDKFFPLLNCSYNLVTSVKIKNSKLIFYTKNYSKIKLINEKQFFGYVGNENDPNEIILRKNGLKVRLQINNCNNTIRNNKMYLRDIKVEAALSVIMDCEDSIVSVDTNDKITTFKNWLGLLDETISFDMFKRDTTYKRKLNENIKYKLPNGKISTLKSTSLLLIRNVGHLMTTSSILDKDKNEIGEGIVDTLLTTLCYLKTLKKSSNSKFKSLYIVKPKMHGPEEVKFSVDTFSFFEKFLSIPKNTIKIGIMDEERRTTLNLKECIREAKNRVFFINTGFLDRTGDEIHTSMEAGIMVKKTEMKNLNWINAYEKSNIKIGLNCGFSGFAQIGKGMWAMPDLMDKMIEEKINHCKAGANTAWVPSPTAATLHALHYHEINVFNLHDNIAKNIDVKFDDLLDLPIINKPNWTKEEIQNELDNNIQGILGYVVKWINNGIGCSKVPDINYINLMEDRATLRISSQHISNWLKYNICNKEQVINTFKKMALIVDKQNKNEVNYIPMSNNFDNSIAFKGACDLVLNGVEQPSGYTEPILHAERLKFKNKFNII